MARQLPERAWLLMAAGDNRGHGGNTGYDDQYDAYYSWDSHVPNHRNLRVGDPIALWDKERLLGVSVIEEIETSPGTKSLRRCPNCNTTRISERKRVSPRFRCMKCRHEFASPLIDVVDVELYRARYDAAWTSLDGLLDEREIRSLAVHPGDINAMRPLDWARFGETLRSKGADVAVDRVTARVDTSRQPSSGPQVEMPQGFSQALVRVRRGQRQFAEASVSSGRDCSQPRAAPARSRVARRPGCWRPGTSTATPSSARTSSTADSCSAATSTASSTTASSPSSPPGSGSTSHPSWRYFRSMPVSTTGA